MVTFKKDNEKGEERGRRIEWSPLLVAMEQYALDHGGMTKNEEYIFRAGWNACSVALRKK